MFNSHWDNLPHVGWQCAPSAACQWLNVQSMENSVACFSQDFKKWMYAEMIYFKSKPVILIQFINIHNPSFYYYYF